MNRRQFLLTATAAAAGVSLKGCTAGSRMGAGSAAAGPPNIVIIFTDDQGYGDAGCYGAKGFETPNLDRMATEGVRFTDFYVAAPVSTPSRAALLTGCYPQRVGLPDVLYPNSKIGINSNEVTIAEMLKSLGYTNACYGKWHLGDLPEFLPTRHGFDEYFGLPYSNDMYSHHPTIKDFPPLPLIENEKVIRLEPDQTQLTTWYTERAIRFIERNKDKPFFVYLPHSMPHVPLHVSDKFKGRSRQGLYGDVIMEIDWSAGEILSTLKRLGIDDRTLVIFASDNGPWLSYGNHAGSALPLREGKGTTFDGGQRVPCIMRWPTKIPNGMVCRETATAMDILPTVAELTGARMPSNKIDGKDIWPLMSCKPGAKSPHEAFFYYNCWKLEAVRSGRWKLHFPHEYRTLGGHEGGSDGKPANYTKAGIGFALFDLENDVAEQHNLAAELRYAGIIEHLKSLADKMRVELGDELTKVTGRALRPVGRIG